MTKTRPVKFGSISENSFVYYTFQTREIQQVLPHSVDFKAPVVLSNPLSKTVLSKVVLFGI